MQRRKILKGFAALVIAERLGMLRSAWAAGGKLPPPGIYKIKGEVRVNGQLAKEGTLVRPGDTISTGAQSEAIYVIGNDAYLQRDRSTVSIAGDSLKSGLRVVTGKLMSVFGRGEKSLEVGTATIGIRGTGCYIEAEAKQTYFCLCYGKAELTSARMPGVVERLETEHHDMPVYLHADGSKMMAPAPMMNHSDSELTLLESLVGRLPAFHGKGFSSY